MFFFYYPTCKIPSVNHLYGRTKKGIMFVKKEGKQLRQGIILLLKTAMNNQNVSTFENKPLQVRVVLRFPDGRRRDVDNYMKFILDSAKEIVFDDDSNIYRLIIEKKIQHPKPGFELEVEVMPDAEKHISKSRGHTIL